MQRYLLSLNWTLIVEVRENRRQRLYVLLTQQLRTKLLLALLRLTLIEIQPHRVRLHRRLQSPLRQLSQVDARKEWVRQDILHPIVRAQP